MKLNASYFHAYEIQQLFQWEDPALTINVYAINIILQT